MNGAIFFGVVIGASVAGLVFLLAWRALSHRLRVVEAQQEWHKSRISDLGDFRFSTMQALRELGLEWQMAEGAKWVKPSPGKVAEAA